ncbi:glycoside hydrolase family 19 protein [Winslowiella arboricola]|uniref:glycoside hydrolase family 19 protein n=1 Tax=Winslowiella arboricola TaxID=2978220 RepID=UPI00225E0FE9|nr:glycoside hydrolase family 19 protein [Winslowiella arboricola]MCU5775212.1 glycoside hydrolase family 19 protein [Winslowiella arboricola]
MTESQFQRAAGISAGLAARWFPHVDKAMTEFGVNLPLEKAMFIAQVGHESNGFTATVENFNYSVQALMVTFVPKRLTRDQALMLGRKPGESPLSIERQKAIANLVYQKRFGNNLPGDGWKYRGRGLMQTTFLDNYRATGNGLKLDLVGSPELLEQDENAVRAAAWFFVSKGCLRWANDVERCTQIINGGDNGLADRKARFKLARSVMV